MRLRSVQLITFRNHRETTLDCSPYANVFLGENGAGKTNILEGISFLCLTKSFYAASDTTVLQQGAEAFEVVGAIESDGGMRYDVRVRYTAEERKKEIRINHQVPERISAVVGQFPVVVLSPENSSITFGGPGDRRRFLDLAIAQASRSYLEDLLEYRRILRQRNRILADQRDRPHAIDELLEPWNATLAARGARITQRRAAFVRELEPAVRDAFRRIAGERELPQLLFEPSFPLQEDADETAVERSFLEQLTKRSREERRMGTTLTGPHRDEIGMRINGLDLRGFASQGQHKTFLVALKLAEFEYLKERCRETPMLLLDDVLSELDEHRAVRLLKEAAQAGQTFITSTDRRPFVDSGSYRRFMVNAGKARADETTADDTSAA